LLPIPSLAFLASDVVVELLHTGFVDAQSLPPRSPNTASYFGESTQTLAHARQADAGRRAKAGGSADQSAHAALTFIAVSLS
jgi:hypothetical protein